MGGRSENQADRLISKTPDRDLLKFLRDEIGHETVKPPHEWSEEQALKYLYPVFTKKDTDGGGLLDMDEVNEMLVGLIGFKLLPRDIEAMERVLDPERSGITFEKFRSNLVCCKMLTDEEEKAEDMHVQLILLHLKQANQEKHLIKKMFDE